MSTIAEGIEIGELPAFKDETDALLERFAAEPAGPELDPYEAVLLDRQELPDPDLAGERDSRTSAEALTIDLPDRTLHARVYRFAAEPRPLVLWLHGGGFIGGDLRDIEYAASGIAAAGNVTVVSLNYRLAPEDPFPAGLHDVRDTLEWLRDHAADLTETAGSRSAGRVRAPRSPPAPACSRATRAACSPTGRSSATRASTTIRTPSRSTSSTARSSASRPTVGHHCSTSRTASSRRPPYRCAPRRSPAFRPRSCSPPVVIRSATTPATMRAGSRSTAYRTGWSSTPTPCTRS